MLFEIIIISVIGSLLHFTYDFSNHNKFVGLFSAVNESTWEHIKMGLTAIFVCSLVDFFFYGTNPSYFFAKFISLIVFIITIPIIFYGYTLFTKKSIVIIDIFSFYISVILSVLSFKSILNINLPSIYNFIGLVSCIVILGLYLVFTILPIKNFLFIDPITKKYGFKGHSK